MESTLLLFAIGWIALGILLVTFIVGDFLEFLSFDVLDGSFGPTSIFGFIAVFGLTGGTLNQNTDWPLMGCLAVALVAGLIFAVIVSKIFSFFTKSNSGEVSEDNIIGDTGYVVLTIPENGYGKVKVNNSGHVMELAAMSGGVKIPTGTSVRVKSLLGSSSVIVEMLEEPKIPEIPVKTDETLNLDKDPNSTNPTN